MELRNVLLALLASHAGQAIGQSCSTTYTAKYAAPSVASGYTGTQSGGKTLDLCFH